MTKLWDNIKIIQTQPTSNDTGHLNLQDDKGTNTTRLAPQERTQITTNITPTSGST
jgi:hypothetical protein